jgi:hypothetical protein
MYKYKHKQHVAGIKQQVLSIRQQAASIEFLLIIKLHSYE